MKETEFVVIGAGLTGLTLAFYLKKAGKNVIVLEKSKHVGGVIHSVNEDGFTYETGPTTGVLGSVEIAELFEDLHDSCVLETADKSAKKRYIWKKDSWHAIPSGLFSAVGTPLFRLYDKFRILGEPFRKAGGYPDEPVAELVKRRLGKSFLDYAVDPFISGVYAGDPNKLITRYALPKLYALENNYGGFVKGAMAKKKEPKMPDAHKATREVFSVAGGLESLTKAMAGFIGAENILTECDQLAVVPDNGKYIVTFNQNSDEKYAIDCAKVISTVGGYALPEVLSFLPEHDLKPLQETSYAAVIQVAVGYKHWQGIKLDAFGGLVPSKEDKNVLGVLFPSAIFPKRAPENGAMLSVFLGGMRNPDLFYRSDEDIIELVDEAMKNMMKTAMKPDLIRIHRHRYAIAQYDVKSGERLSAIDRIQKQYPGLLIAGSVRDGIGMSDRVKQAKTIFKEIIQN